MAVRAESYIPKRAPAKIETEALKTAGGFWQKCHTRSFSDSRLLQKARMLRYLPSSRSARIVVTPLHESPGPTTAGASLFWPHQARSDPSAPCAKSDGSQVWSAADLTKRSVRCYHCRWRQNAWLCELKIRPRCRRRRRACAVSPPGRALGEVASDVLAPEVKSQRRRDTLLEMTSARSGWEINSSLTENPRYSRGPKERAR